MEGSTVLVPAGLSLPDGGAPLLLRPHLLGQGPVGLAENGQGYRLTRAQARTDSTNFLVDGSSVRRRLSSMEAARESSGGAGAARARSAARRGRGRGAC